MVLSLSTKSIFVQWRSGHPPWPSGRLQVICTVSWTSSSLAMQFWIGILLTLCAAYSYYPLWKILSPLWSILSQFNWTYWTWKAQPASLWSPFGLRTVWNWSPQWFAQFVPLMLPHLRNVKSPCCASSRGNWSMSHVLHTHKAAQFNRQSSSMLWYCCHLFCFGSC